MVKECPTAPRDGGLCKMWGGSAFSRRDPQGVIVVVTRGDKAGYVRSRGLACPARAHCAVLIV